MSSRVNFSCYTSSCYTSVKVANIPVSRLDGLFDFPASFILNARSCAKGDQWHLILISHSLSGDVYKVVDLLNQVVALTLCFSTIIPQLIKCAATTDVFTVLSSRANGRCLGNVIIALQGVTPGSAS